MSNKDAINKAERIDYKINLTGNRLLLPPYFSIPKADKLRRAKTRYRSQSSKRKTELNLEKTLTELNFRKRST